MALLFPCKKAGGIGLASLVITTAPTKTTYAQYDSLDLTGLEVTATFKDGLVADVTDLCQITPADGSELSDYGNIDITIKYANKTVTQSITVNQMTAIAVTTQPTKTSYLVGENLNLSGIVVTGTAGALSRNVTSLAEYDPADGTQLNTQGTQRVDVEYENLNNYFEVEVLIRSMLKKLPYNFSLSWAVVLNNEIHLLGAQYSRNHYKWNGENWVFVSTLPYDFYGGAAVVLNNEIYIMGSDYYSSRYEYAYKFYKWNGSSWIDLNGLNSQFTNGSAVVWNGEIYRFNYNNWYKWNGSSWSNNLGTLPYTFYGTALVYRNEIHILGGTTSHGESSSVLKKHYKWNGSSWENVSTLPIDFKCEFGNMAAVLNDKIHIINGTNHYSWDGTSWTQETNVPHNCTYYGAVVAWNSGVDEIVAIAGGTSSSDDAQKIISQWDDNTWITAT